MTKETLQPQDKYVLRLPNGMRARIKSAAEKNNRSMNAEIVATLEEAYPSALPAPFFYPNSEIGMLILYWHSGVWSYFDWDDWQRLKAGDLNLRYFAGPEQKSNYFVVIVVDEHSNLVNLIVNHLLIVEKGWVDAGFNMLDDEDQDDYIRLMTSPSSTPADEERLSVIRSRMAPAYKLPENSLPALRGVLLSYAASDTVDNLIEKRCR